MRVEFRAAAVLSVVGLVGLTGLAALVGCGGGGSSSSGGSQQTAPQAPTANAGGPYTATIGASISFSGTGSSDPQGQTLTYAWNFGDSSTGTGASPSHTYAATGVYTVTLTVTDTSGLTGTTTSKATVELADVAMTGTVSSGTQPVTAAHVYLFAANTTGYGGAGLAAASTNASVSLLNAGLTGGSDSVGAYVTTGSNGGFSVSGDYTCTNGQQLYLYARSSTAGSGAGWLAAVGPCPGTSGTAIAATVNEVSTVAAAYALAGFATDALHVSSSGTALAQTGIANAFGNAASLETLSTGAALATTTAGGGTVPQTEINTLANVLESCTKTGGSCTTLFADATVDGTPTGTQPTDTATAAINIAHHPGANVAALDALAAGGPFTPGLTSAPNDWTVAISFTGSNTPETIAVDTAGGVWFADYGANAVVKLSSKGAASATYTSSTISALNEPIGIAIDGSGNAWITNLVSASVVEISNAGTVLSGSGGYTGGGLTEPAYLAIDAAGDVWVTNPAGTGHTATVVELAPTGSILSGSSGYSVGTANQVEQITIDGSGNAWISTPANEIVELSNTGSLLSGLGGYTGGGLAFGSAIAANSAGDIWVGNHTGTNVTELSNTGTVLSGSSGYSGGGLNDPNLLAIDGAGNIWLTNNTPGITELSSNGTFYSGTNGYGSSLGARGIAVDGSGDVWITGGAVGSGAVTEYIGAGAPVITPIVAGLQATPTANGSSKLGTRP